MMGISHGLPTTGFFLPEFQAYGQSSAGLTANIAFIFAA
ncbi:hypothetical protein ALP68_100605 [Pseudomonas ficuserectae]|uniref:Uncharacterized protein n=11 Tax=Pseudomonas syringae group TaxID=136849 RepID=A0AAX1VZ68_PSEAJ|nr:hypothetical protein PSPPH_3914 [Pseudomonas savastanoi pv. phaseolicola 1448A]KPW41249.1 50S ribosomal protein L31 type B [Pseudomonas amygdali]KPX01485.1 hypothetical protein ALO74_04401 [Pseudomonas syringae pv. cunninghamiae]KPX07227.1 hypothetical protein ALO73_04954 [Pseudomonas syringae pv. daphniphylli]KPX45963.1 hypothetical protein ALO37_04993 [Pseudomonas savastanoi pv. glycinea]KPX66845.1 hypothetical protein ALO35_04621 [Pseudomonas amygdali pv. lachrymans]KPX80612.1 hypotheti